MQKLVFMWLMNGNLGQDGRWLWDRLLASQVVGGGSLLAGCLAQNWGLSGSVGMRPQTHLFCPPRRA